MSGSNNEITNTGGPGSSAEPSMEEILASIRRILKDEDVVAQPAPGAAGAEDEEEDILVLDSAMVIPRAADPASAPAPSPSWEVAPWPEASEPLPPKAPPEEQDVTIAEAALPEEPSPHLTSELAEPDFPEFVNETVDLPPPETEPDAPPAPEPIDITEAGAAGSAKETPMSDDTQENVTPPPGLVSAAASEAAASSIGSLIRSISSERSIAIGRPGLTLEDLVREELRPLLKSWLDSHLPSLVERIVRAEIQLVVERSTG